MLRQRIATALILVAVLLGALVWSPLAISSLAAVIAAAAMFEWLRLAGYAGRPAIVGGALFGGALLVLQVVVAGDRLSGPLAVLCGGAVVGWLAVGALLVVVQRRGVHAGVPGRAGRLALVLLALLFLGGLWAGFVELVRGGPLWLVSILALVWAADIAAYFVGRAVGRRKLAARISPGKTWAGAWGALAAVLIVAFAAHALWPRAHLLSSALIDGAGSPLAAALLALLVSLAIVGDLFESLLKRQAGVKDSSRLLPGHGGVLDRIDALLPVLPLALLIQRWLAR
jgi:phosphatidate cytidylyltransferase